MTWIIRRGIANGSVAAGVGRLREGRPSCAAACPCCRRSLGTPVALARIRHWRRNAWLAWLLHGFRHDHGSAGRKFGKAIQFLHDHWGQSKIDGFFAGRVTQDQFGVDVRPGVGDRHVGCVAAQTISTRPILGMLLRDQRCRCTRRLDLMSHQARPKVVVRGVGGTVNDGGWPGPQEFPR
jgi:hypothetical protein